MNQTSGKLQPNLAQFNPHADLFMYKSNIHKLTQVNERAHTNTQNFTNLLIGLKSLPLLFLPCPYV